MIESAEEAAEKDGTLVHVGDCQADVVRHADVIVLAVPTHRFRELAPDLFADKILIDAMTYWQPVDGEDPVSVGGHNAGRSSTGEAPAPC